MTVLMKERKLETLTSNRTSSEKKKKKITIKKQKIELVCVSVRETETRR
jgi:hypothetical protein